MNQNIKNGNFGDAKTYLKHSKSSFNVLQKAFLRQPRVQTKNRLERAEVRLHLTQLALRGF